MGKQGAHSLLLTTLQSEKREEVSFGGWRSRKPVK